MFKNSSKSNNQQLSVLSISHALTHACTKSRVSAPQRLRGRLPSPSTKEARGGESHGQGRRVVSGGAGIGSTQPGPWTPWSECHSRNRCSSSRRATTSPIFIKMCIYTISEYVLFCFEGITSFYLNPTHYVCTNLRGRTRQAMTGKQKQVTKDRTVLTSPLVGPFSFCWQRLITSNNKGPPTVPSASIIPKSRAKFSRPSRPWNWERNKI